MPLTRTQRSDAFRILRLISERDMPSNNTLERLVLRSTLPEDRVLWALEFLWNDDAGFIQVDDNRKTGERGYFVDPRCRSKSPMDLDALFIEWEANQEDDEDEDEDEDEDSDDDDDDDEDDD